MTLKANSKPVVAENENYTLPITVLTSLFFMWGFMTVMNDILIPYLKGVFELNYTQAMLVQLAFFGAYFVGSLIYFIISVTKGDPINKIGYKNGIIIGLLIAAVGTAMFLPAAQMQSYGFFLSALFIIGIGFTLLQIAANPYVAILGSEETASGRLNLSQGFNSLGTTLAPVLGGFLIFSYFGGKEAMGADSVVVPYLIFSGIFVLLALFIKAVNLPRFTNEAKIESGLSIFKHRNLTLGFIAIFMYVGAEVSIGSMLINFLGLESIAGLPEKEAGQYVSFYWGGLMIGRFIGAMSLSNLNKNFKVLLTLVLPGIAFLIIFALKGIETASFYGVFLALSAGGFFLGRSLSHRTLYIFALIIIGLLITALMSEGSVAMWSIIGIGLFNSIMWSNIFTLSIAGLGSKTSQGSSLLVMAIVGGAVFPLLQGFAADSIGVHESYAVPIIAYMYLVYYGLNGYKRSGDGD